MQMEAVDGASELNSCLVAASQMIVGKVGSRSGGLLNVKDSCSDKLWC